MEGEAEVGAALGDRVGGGLRIVRDYPHLHGRVLGNERRKHLGQEMDGEAVEGQDGDRAAGDPAPFVDLALEPCKVLEGGPEVVVDEATAVGQPHPVGPPLE